MLALIEVVERLLARLGIASGLSTLLITLIVVVDVAARGLLNQPIHGATELCELLLVAMVFFGLAAAQQERQNYALDIAVRHLPGSVQSFLELVSHLFCLGLVLVLSWLSTKQAISSFERGEAGFGIFPFPIWPARFVLAIGFWMLAAQFLCDTIRHVMRRPRLVSKDGAGAGSHE